MSTPQPSHHYLTSHDDDGRYAVVRRADLYAVERIPRPSSPSETSSSTYYEEHDLRSASGRSRGRNGRRRRRAYCDSDSDYDYDSAGGGGGGDGYRRRRGLDDDDDDDEKRRRRNRDVGAFFAALFCIASVAVCCMEAQRDRHGRAGPVDRPRPRPRRG